MCFYIYMYVYIYTCQDRRLEPFHSSLWPWPPAEPCGPQPPHPSSPQTFHTPLPWQKGAIRTSILVPFCKNKIIKLMINEAFNPLCETEPLGKTVLANPPCVWCHKEVATAPSCTTTTTTTTTAATHVPTPTAKLLHLAAEYRTLRNTIFLFLKIFLLILGWWEEGGDEATANFFGCSSGGIKAAAADQSAARRRRRRRRKRRRRRRRGRGRNPLLPPCNPRMLEKKLYSSRLLKFPWRRVAENHRGRRWFEVQDYRIFWIFPSKSN